MKRLKKSWNFSKTKTIEKEGKESYHHFSSIYIPTNQTENFSFGLRTILIVIDKKEKLAEKIGRDDDQSSSSKKEKKTSDRRRENVKW